MASSALARFCTSCGSPVEESNRFCTGCGTPASALVPTPVRAGEHRGGESVEDGPSGRSGRVSTHGDYLDQRTHTTSAEQIDLFRYHDLTTRLAAFSTNGGEFLRGNAEDLEIDDAEPRYDAGEEELARIAGVVELVGSRSIPGTASEPSLGLVASGAGMLVLTNRRLIVMFQHPGTTQLGQLDGSEVHTFVLPWDLVDSISMPARKSLKDRVAGARVIELYALAVGSVLKIMPVARELGGGQTDKLREDEAMALLARTAATHRLSVSPPHDHMRLRALLDAPFPISDGEIVANITDEETEGIPAHLVGRLVEHREAEPPLPVGER